MKWILLLLCSSLVAVAETAPLRPLDQVKALAASYEQQGAKAEALEAYEEIVRREPTARQAVGTRLVQLYAETKQPQRALDLAREIMKTLPDPQAYLADVYARVGGYPEARAILDKELAAEQTAHRKVTLNWQLADLCEKTGDQAGARSALATAAELAKGTPDEPAAKRQAEALEKRASAKP